MQINQKRIRLLQKGDETAGAVVYWMSRDQRAYDNWALLFAQKSALDKKRPLAVVFNLIPQFLEAGFRQYAFMLKGLEKTEKDLSKHNIPFFITMGEPSSEIPKFLDDVNASMLISDFDPLRIKREWKRDTARKISIPFFEVDAHNIVPCLYVSQKQEYAAYTLRPKIHKALPEFLDEFPDLKKMQKHELDNKIDWGKIYSSLKVNKEIKEIDWALPGQSSGHKMLEDFLFHRFDNYSSLRNDPSVNGQSNLSPYLHFGQIAAQRAAIQVKKFSGNKDSEEAFLEELIVRKELSDNFCYYNKNYDSIKGFPGWAQKTLEKHKNDKRDFIYTKDEFENAKTHEDLWNAAQTELVSTGKMHGYMRMYWAKKILEWTNTPQYALHIAQYLNDKYEIDGRDPNGYTGCAWAIGGVHDRPWFEREIFGQVRYMNREGAKRKFDIDAYIKKYKR